MAKLIVLGNVAVDVLVPACDPPPPGGSVIAPDVRVDIGGQATHTAIVASRLGVSTAIVGLCGDDLGGQLLTDRLKAEGVDVTRFRKVDGGATPANVVLHDANGDTRSYCQPGTNAKFEVPEIAYRAPCDIFHVAAPEMIVGTWPRAAIEIVRKLKVAGKRVSVATHARGEAGGAALRKNASEHRHLLDLVDIVITSEEQAKVISGRAEWESVVRYFHERGVGTVAIKRGARGAVVSRQGRIEAVPATRVQAVETYGAGDSFAAGFLAGLIQNDDPLRATRMGCIVAGLSVRARGALAGTANRAMVQKALSVLDKKRKPQLEF